VEESEISRLVRRGYSETKTVSLIIGIGLIITGTFFFVSSALVNCQGSLIVAGGCEQWRSNAFITLLYIGVLFFCAAAGVLVFGRKR
jgi:hypothetical protein